MPLQQDITLKDNIVFVIMLVFVIVFVFVTVLSVQRIQCSTNVVYSALLKKRGGVHTAARHHLKVQDCLCHCVCASVCICVCHCLVSTMYNVVP